MKKSSMFVTSFIIVLVLAITSFAQDAALTPGDGWRLSSEMNLTQTQNAYSDNWAADEYGSISWAFTSNSIAERQFTALMNNRSTLKMSFGQTHNQQKEDRHWQEPYKSTDLIDLESVLRLTFGGYVDPYAAIRWQSQFYSPDNQDGTDWLDPNTLTESVGIARNLIKKENQEWIVRLGFGLRQYIDRNSVYNEVKEEWESFDSNDGGLELVSEVSSPIVEGKLKVTSKLTIFKAFFYSEADAIKGTEYEDYWEEPDLNLETIFTANITKYIMVNLYTQLLYDKEVDLAGRFKETMSLGLTYTLF